MHQIYIRHTKIFAQILMAFICLTSLSAIAHAGHEHKHEHQITKAKGGDFTLQSANGPVTLSKFNQKVVTIYFGYTHCTDACPFDLGRLSKALKSMKPEEIDNIQPLFITVDPERDNAAVMAKYSASFHPKLIGLTGTQAEVDAVTKAYGVEYEKGPVNAKGDYDIEHPSTIYLVGKDGKLLGGLPKSPANIVTALRKALNAK